MRLSIEHTGRYKFFVKLRSGLSQQAQSSCNLLLNGKPVATVQTNGTGKRVESDKAGEHLSGTGRLSGGAAGREGRHGDSLGGSVQVENGERFFAAVPQKIILCID